MTLELGWVTVDCKDARAVARFWEQVLGYERTHDPKPDDDDVEVEISPPGGGGPKLLFLEVDEDKVVKNRLHFDLRPAPGEQFDEVARVESLGGRRVDIGQGELREDMTWIVMADPEGNEFCILQGKQES